MGVLSWQGEMAGSGVTVVFACAPSAPRERVSARRLSHIEKVSQEVSF
jgi:hypothetical protein